MLSSIIIIGSCIWFINNLDTLLNKILLFIAIYISGSYYQISLGVYFIALSYIIVYIGAIAIQFQFIIMIVSPTPTLSQASSPLIQLGFISLGALGTPTQYVGNITGKSWLAEYTGLVGDLQNLSIFIFNGWPFTTLQLGMLLTSCLIGILEILGR